MIASFQTAFENVEQSTNFLAPSIALFLGVLVLFHFFSFFSLKNHRVIAEDDQWSVFLGSPTLNDALAWTLLGLSVAVAFCSISSVIIILIGLYLICVIQPQLAGTIAAKSNCVMLIDLLSIAIWFLCMSVLINELIGFNTILNYFLFGSKVGLLWEDELLEEVKSYSSC